MDLIHSTYTKLSEQTAGGTVAVAEVVDSVEIKVIIGNITQVSPGGGGDCRGGLTMLITGRVATVMGVNSTIVGPEARVGNQMLGDT